MRVEVAADDQQGLWYRQIEKDAFEKSCRAGKAVETSSPLSMHSIIEWGISA